MGLVRDIRISLDRGFTPRNLRDSGVDRRYADPSGSLLPESPIGEEIVSPLTRHGELGGWAIDVIYANPLLPREQQNDEIIFRVLMTRGAGSSPPPDLAKGAALITSQGLVREGFSWELEESEAGRVRGYLTCAGVSYGSTDLISDETRWIRLSLAEPNGAPALFDWKLGRLQGR